MPKLGEGMEDVDKGQIIMYKAQLLWKNNEHDKAIDTLQDKTLVDVCARDMLNYKVT